MHPFRYFLGAKFTCTPYDPKGSAIAETLYMRAYTTQPKFLQPNFEFEYLTDGNKRSAEFYFKFSNQEK